MARKYIQHFIDDLDGTSYEPGKGETVSFGLDGRTYEIDLSAENAADLRDTLAAYINSGRRAKSDTAAVSHRKTSAGTDNENRQARQWAVSVGMPVSSRGRVSADVLTAYHHAQTVGV